MSAGGIAGVVGLYVHWFEFGRVMKRKRKRNFREAFEHRNF